MMGVHEQPSNGGLFLKVVMGILGFFLVAYIMGPPLYWHFAEGLATSCPLCSCDCDSQPLSSVPPGIINISFAECGKHDPEVNGDMENNFTELLSEELKLREAESLENQKRADIALLEAKKMASQYQKEADKCNSGMETCEEARERAEVALLAQKELSAMWELRARQRGWVPLKTRSRF